MQVFFTQLVTSALLSSDAHNLIEEQSGVVREDQLILHRGKLLPNIEHFPVSDADHPLFLFNKKNNNVSIAKFGNISKQCWLLFYYFLTKNRFIFLAKPQIFTSAISVENDASIAKQYSCIGFSIKRRIEELYRCCKHLFESVNVLRYVL